ncbi:hypothetical protein HYH03_003257 [Edaphochlamys debaryana]|uniref:Uncharacterized protein n=1 Tax=Edaphochlamys debaryana TaxID=47281 RepID=A0A836C4S3_9CHLO|nr:hypothetical protein HYH03_003257 [Edaphochlamys debaryana]|eukprot:KAG2499074.1 hypothetical protein HYH03_003257 [Edaphochlamys debaryana]
MASEVIALCHSFEQEISKSLSVLPAVSASQPEQHDQHMNHHRLSQRVVESVSYYAGRLPAYASIPRILSYGDRLLRLAQHKLALEACYKYVRSLQLHQVTEKLPRMDASARLSSHVQACFGCAACEAALLLLADPQIKHPDTLQGLVDALIQLRAALSLAIPDENLYWLVVNGTVHVYTTAKALITAGFAEQALPVLVFCIKALEGHVAFAAPKYLPWRTQLYTWAVYGLVDCGAVEQARALLTDGLKRIEQLVALQKLDPVPASPEVAAAFNAAKAVLVGLQLRVEVGAGSPVTPVLAQLSAAAAAAVPAGGGGGATVAQVGLAALVEALHAPQRRVVRTEPVDATLKELFEAAMATAAPLLAAIKKAVDDVAAAKAGVAAAQEAAAAAASSAGPAAEGEGAAPPPAVSPEAAIAEADTAHAAAVAAVEAAEDQLPYALHKGLLCAAYNLEQWAQFQELATVAQGRVAAVYGDAASIDVENPAAQLATSASLLLALRQLSTEPGVEALRTLATTLQQALISGVPVGLPQTNSPPPRLSVTGSPAGSPSGNGNGTNNGNAAAAAVAQSEMQQTQRFQQSQLAPYQQLKDLIADASLALYGSARPLIDGVFCCDDREAYTVAELLAACVAAWQAVDLDDGELRVAAALKLALLLEEDGKLTAARDVLVQAKATVQRVRVELMAANRRAADEHLRWITGSRSQPDDEKAALVADMTPSEQELACLHVDVLALLARVELGVGVAEQHGRATARKTQELEEQAKRTAQSSIFGARNRAELARDEARLAAVSTTTPNPQQKERELLAACGKNYYERALVLTQMTAFAGSDGGRKAQLLQEAGDLLTKAQAAEDGLFTAMQPELRTRREVPPQPKLLQRTPTSVTLVAHPPGPGLKAPPGARKPPTRYVAYCKAFGAGVGLSINKTATEYPGSGVMTPLGQPVTIQGLRTNDTYLFAVALYDEDGAIVGGLGTSTPEVVLALPLPLLMCWTHLLAAAVRSGASGAVAAKRAAGVLLPHFVVTTPDVPIWRSNPMDAQRLHRAHLAAAARPLVRAAVQCIYVYGGAALLRGAAGAGASGAGANPPTLAPAAPVPQVALPCTLPQLKQPFLEEQVARLKAARLLVLGMELAATLPDEPLMQEGALRTYALLSPLLALRSPRSGLLHKALAACHSVLSSLTNLVQDSLHRQEHQRALAARVAAAVTYQLIRLSDQAGEKSASTHFGTLKQELLKAYDPRFAIAGRPPAEPGAASGPLAGLQPEASRLHDEVLMHPRLLEWQPEALQERQKEANDLAAKVLPIIAGPSPMDAWAAALCYEPAAEHPRWMELVVRMLEAAVRKGSTAGAAAVAEGLVWWVRGRSKVPPLEFSGDMDQVEEASEVPESPKKGAKKKEKDLPPPPPPGPPPKWTLEAAAAALPPSKLLGAFEPPPPPPTEGLSPEDAAALLAQHEAEARAAEDAVRRRVAAVMLLQRRLPKMLARKREIERIRADIKRWAPWLSRLNAVLGLLSAAAARKYVQAQAMARAAGATAAPVERPSTAQPGPAGSPGADGADGPPPLLPPDGITPPLEAMMHYARAAQLAARGGAWVELANAARHAWNLARGVLSTDPALTAALPKVTWEMREWPEPLVPPEGFLQAAANPGDKKGAKKGGKKEEERGKTPAKTPGSPTARSSGRGKKGQGEELPPPPRLYPLPQGSRSNMARAVRALTDALMEFVSRLRDGLQVPTWIAPMDVAGGAGGKARRGGEEDPRPDTAVSDSQFSYGSDLQVDIWFKEGPLDLAWVSRYMALVAVVLSRGGRWHTLVELGRTWARLSEGVFNERIMPWLLQAAPKAGVDPGAFQAAMDALIRDKNQALDQLDKVRTLARERLGDIPLMAQGMGHKVRKKKKRAGMPLVPGSGAGGGGGSAGGPNSDAASLVSAAYTYRTASTYKTKASQPDFIRIPAEYEKVIELLKRRNEKGAMILASHELGDTHAHFGNWGGAVTAWNDTLDTLLGPYQSLKNWRPKLDPLSPAATLQAYGLHGLLLGCVLAGKLARYVHHDHLNMRLECCRLAGRLAFCAFSAHMGHPQRRVGFATYTPRELWAAGADAWVLWSDPYRCPVVDLAGSLETAAAGLLDAGLAIEALPVLALWEHVARDVTRSLHGTVLCRIMRCRALVALGLLTEACSVAAGLMTASGLPDPVLDSDYILKDAAGSVVVSEPAPPFSNAHLPGEPGNKAALLHIADTPLHAAVEKLYGSWLVAHLTLARAQILMAAGGVPNQWRSTNWKTGERVEVPPATPAPKGGAAGGAKGGAAGAKAGAAAPPPNLDLVGPGLPEVVEGAMLERANVLLRKALAMAKGEDTPPVAETSVASTASAAKPAGRATSPPRSGRSKSPGKGGATAPPPPPAAADPPAPPVSPGQRAEVMVRSLLLLCELEQLRWQPSKALAHALEAAKFIGAEADRVNNPMQGDNDELERHTLSPTLWFLARGAAVRCAAALGHGAHVHALYDNALTKEAKAVHEQLHVAGMAHISALVLEGEGRTAEAMAALAALAAKYRSLSVSDTRLAAVLLDAAALRDRLGLRADASALASQALDVANAYAMELGLGEALDAPELTNVYADGTAIYAHALGVMAVHASRRQQHAEAERRAQRALLLLRNNTRALPAQHAATALLVGRMARLVALCGEGVPSDEQAAAAAATAATAAAEAESRPGTARTAASAMTAYTAVTQATALTSASGVAATAAKLSAAKAALSAAITLACLDGGHLRGVMRSALLELGSIFIAGMDARSAAACLRAAHAASVKQDLLLLSNHTLQPVTANHLPDWAVTHVKGQEALFAQSTGRNPNAPVADADVARGVVCLLAGLKRSLEGLPVGGGFRERAEAKLAALHAALRGACAKYGTDACFAEPPLPASPNDNPAPADGTVLVQWHCQDGCWQEGRSWRADGSLATPGLPPVAGTTAAAALAAAADAAAAAVTDAQLLALQPVESYASLLYVISAPSPDGDSGPHCGEVTFAVKDIRELHRRLKQLRSRLEKPKAPTDLLGYPAPTPAELSDLLRATERLLSAVPRSSEDGSSAAFSGVESGMSGSEAMVGEVRPTLDAAFLCRLEALLSLEGGLDVADVTLGSWLVQTLPVLL